MELTLTSREHLGDNVWRYTFNTPEKLSWIAGQFMRLDIPHDRPDAAGTSRFFTISSPPSARSPQITTRLSSSTFKQALQSKTIGARVMMADYPAGDFIWNENTHRPVFLATGIGITPFNSILQERAFRHLPMGATLIHSNRPESFVPYGRGLKTLATQFMQFTYMQTTDPISAELVGQLVPDLAERSVFVSGPDKLLKLTYPPYNLPARQLKTDYFPGYSKRNY